MQLLWLSQRKGNYKRTEATTKKKKNLPTTKPMTTAATVAIATGNVEKMSISGNVERSLVLIKPDGIVRRQAGISVIKSLLALPGIQLISFKEVAVSEALARLHYAEHEGKPFFPFLLRMITAKCGVVMLAFEGIGAIKKASLSLSRFFFHPPKFLFFPCTFPFSLL